MLYLQVLCWICVGLCLYTYIGYPIVLAFLANLSKSRSTRKRVVQVAAARRISIAIAVYNEANILREKLKNLEVLRCEGAELEILIGSDGSTDETNEILRQSKLQNLMIKIFPVRRGKAAVLNELLSLARGEIIILSDANTFFEPDTVERLIHHFADARVGAVTGELRLEAGASGTGSLGEISYWNYENWIKRCESEIVTTLGATGAVYAIRKNLFVPLPENKVVMDDFLIPLSIIKRGYSVRYEPNALAYEHSAGTVRAEFKRKMRIGAANFHGLAEYAELLHPRHGFVAFALWSHKIIRWVVPFLMLIIIGCTIVIATQSPLFQMIVILEGVFFALALIGLAAEIAGIPLGILAFPYYFLAMNIALLIGFFKFLFGQQQPTWEVIRS